MCYIWFVNVHFQGLYEVNCIRLGFRQVRNLNEKGKNFGGICAGESGQFNREILESDGLATASNLAGL